MSRFDQEWEHINYMFDMIDTDGNGEVDAAELEAAFAHH
jgi:Ca2+-binding EF-hand superfamily protein